MAVIYCFGDSITYGKWDPEGGWVARLRKHIDQTYNIGKNGNVQVYNLGIPGEVAVRMKDRVEAELSSRDNKDGKGIVLFEIGVNDSCLNNWMTERQTPEQDFKGALKQMVAIARKYSCKAYFMGLAPVNPARAKKLLFSDGEVKRYDGYISDVARELGVTKIDMFDELKALNFADLLVDSVHPNESGHQLIFEKVRDALLGIS